MQIYILTEPICQAPEVQAHQHHWWGSCELYRLFECANISFVVVALQEPCPPPMVFNCTHSLQIIQIFWLLTNWVGWVGCGKKTKNLIIRFSAEIMRILGYSFLSWNERKHFINQRICLFGHPKEQNNDIYSSLFSSSKLIRKNWSIGTNDWLAQSCRLFAYTCPLKAFVWVFLFLSVLWMRFLLCTYCMKTCGENLLGKKNSVEFTLGHIKKS